MAIKIKTIFRDDDEYLELCYSSLLFLAKENRLNELEEIVKRLPMDQRLILKKAMDLLTQRLDDIIAAH